MTLKNGDEPKMRPYTKGSTAPVEFHRLHLLSRYFVGICRSEATNYSSVDQIDGRFSTKTMNSTNQRVVRRL